LISDECNSLFNLKIIKDFFKMFEILINMMIFISKSLIVNKNIIESHNSSLKIKSQLFIEIWLLIFFWNLYVFRELQKFDIKFSEYLKRFYIEILIVLMSIFNLIWIKIDLREIINHILWNLKRIFYHFILSF
jgi:hypothetical protein